jgi:hypothetical protein
LANEWSRDPRAQEFRERGGRDRELDIPDLATTIESYTKQREIFAEVLVAFSDNATLTGKLFSKQSGFAMVVALIDTDGSLAFGLLITAHIRLPTLNFYHLHIIYDAVSFTA